MRKKLTASSAYRNGSLIFSSSSQDSTSIMYHILVTDVHWLELVCHQCIDRFRGSTAVHVHDLMEAQNRDYAWQTAADRCAQNKRHQVANQAKPKNTTYPETENG
jgi:hypothetical protein